MECGDGVGGKLVAIGFGDGDGGAGGGEGFGKSVAGFGGADEEEGFFGGFGEEVPDDMTKAEASMKIEELREKTGTGEPPKKRKAKKA